MRDSSLISDGSNIGLPVKTPFFVVRGLFDQLSAFTDLHARITALAVEERGSAFEVFAAGLLLADPVHQVVELWSPVDRAPLEILDHLGIKPQDDGIDGIFRDANGLITAYQVKFRSDPNTRLTYSELATFFDQARNADRQLIISTAFGLDAKGHAAATDRPLSTVLAGDLAEMTADDLEDVSALLRLGTQRQHVPLTMAYYQDRAVDAIENEFEHTDRATYVATCGSGKTLVGLRAAERLRARTILVQVPSLGLIRQTVRYWAKNNQWGGCLRFKVVCSAEDVTEALTPADLPFPLLLHGRGGLLGRDGGTTDILDIAAFLHPEHEHGMVKVVFCTYQSSAVIEQALHLSGAQFDLGIIDEAHRTVSGGLFSLVLDNNHIPIAKRLFMTATPRRRKKRSGSLANTDVTFISMDDQQLYGRVVDRYSFQAAIADGVICPVRLVVQTVTPNMLGDLGRNASTVMVDGHPLPINDVASRVALSKAIETTGARRVITFHHRIADASAFVSDGMKGVGRYLPATWRTHHIHGGTPHSYRRQYLGELEQRTDTLVSNCNCLSEGVDIPAVDMVAFISPRTSKVDIVQIVGRTVRRNRQDPSKTHGYVLLPLLLADDEPIESSLNQSGLDQIVDIISAMMDEDDELEELIESGRFLDAIGLGSFSSGRGARGFEVIINGSANSAEHTVDFDRLRQAISIKVLESLRSSWGTYFYRLQELKHAGNDINSLYSYQPDNLDLWSWTCRLRLDHKAGRLATSRVSALDELGMAWDLEGANIIKAALMLEQVSKSGRDIYSFIAMNREVRACLQKCAKRDRSDTIPKQAKEIFDEIGYYPNNTSRKRLWDSAIEQLKLIFNNTGSANVGPYYRCSDGTRLGEWLQRRRMEKLNGTLGVERIAILEQLGVKWLDG